jgi:hypothetical protein
VAIVLSRVIFSQIAAAVGYDAGTREMVIGFCDSGRRSEYDGVPPEVARDLITAERPGGYFHRRIRRGGYSYRRPQRDET